MRSVHHVLAKLLCEASSAIEFALSISLAFNSSRASPSRVRSACEEPHAHRLARSKQCLVPGYLSPAGLEKPRKPSAQRRFGAVPQAFELQLCGKASPASLPRAITFRFKAGRVNKKRRFSSSLLPLCSPVTVNWVRRQHLPFAN
jgi:hypothetical protein